MLCSEDDGSEREQHDVAAPYHSSGKKQLLEHPATPAVTSTVKCLSHSLPVAVNKKSAVKKLTAG
jgi:hypothetical protein